MNSSITVERSNRTHEVLASLPNEDSLRKSGRSHPIHTAEVNEWLNGLNAEAIKAGQRRRIWHSFRRNFDSGLCFLLETRQDADDKPLDSNRRGSAFVRLQWRFRVLDPDY